MGETTVFARACEERQWSRPAVFRAAYAAVAGRLKEPPEVTARQLHRWREPDPPCPRPSRQRVLEEMFGMPLARLGFAVPAHLRKGPPPAAAAPGTLASKTGRVNGAGASGASSGTSSAAIRFAVLGPVRIWRGQESVPLGGPQERAVLCILLLREGRTATAHELIDAIWGETPPECALATLRTYASRLRKMIGPDALVSEAGGYALRVAPGKLDLAECERYQAQAKRARAEGDLAQAQMLLRKAVELWEGEPLAGVLGPYADTQRDRLAQWQLTLLEMRSEVDLELGLHREAVSDLTALTAEHPLRERLRALLMLALYRSGRQAEALDVYAGTRRLLTEELGVEPGPELAELHQRLLRADPALAAPPHTAIAAGLQSVPVPQQLPAPPAAFTGRRHELAWLDRALGTEGDRSGTMVISAIGGTGGVGKTWLALHWSHRRRQLFPDGQLYVNLRGFDPTEEPVPASRVLRGFLIALGIQPMAIPEGLDSQIALYRSMVTGRRMLVVLDNARDIAHVEPLLPGSPSCAVLITTRNHPVGLKLHGAHLLDLDVMSETEARGLLAEHLGSRRIEAEPDAVQDLLDYCAGLPLALGIAAARAAVRPEFPLAALADELHDASARLDGLDTGNLSASLRAIISCSYHTLEPRAAEVFRLIAHTPGADISLPAAASLAALPVHRTRQVLRSLETAYLIQQHVPGRYRVHDLLRLYAYEQPPLIAGDQATDTALRRLIDFYLHTAHAGKRSLEPHSPPIALDPATAGCSPQPLLDRETALRWFAAEQPCVMAMHRLAIQRAWHTKVWQLAWAMSTFTHGQGNLHDNYRMWQAGLAATQHEDDYTATFQGRFRFGVAALFIGRTDEALLHLTHAQGLAQQAGDLDGQAIACHELGRTWEELGSYQKAVAYASRSLHLHRRQGSQTGEANQLNAIGWCQAHLGNYSIASAACNEALALYRKLGNRKGQACTLDSLGYVSRHTDDHTSALHYYKEALSLFRELRSAPQEAETLERLGDTYAACGRTAKARSHWHLALALYRTQRRDADATRVHDALNRVREVVPHGPRTGAHEADG